MYILFTFRLENGRVSKELRFKNAYGLNNMMWDFGVPSNDLWNQTLVDKIIQEIDKVRKTCQFLQMTMSLM